ncbi:hypothetical protein HPB50_020606 [Hyalomma asiaticum]|uniref:Uncharacterized protein n=1 Tax=Hyalomma asiaticum TaxID=266040 RepID=A0ACB7S1V3_HYAAI|nr:hypothetical protein HPB50_020606 [Hyalomma asiaticum]
MPFSLRPASSRRRRADPGGDRRLTSSSKSPTPPFAPVLSRLAIVWIVICSLLPEAAALPPVIRVDGEGVRRKKLA